MKLLLIVIGLLVIVQTHIKSLEDIELKKKHLGMVCSFVTISFFASPLVDLVSISLFNIGALNFCNFYVYILFRHVSSG